MVKKNEEAIADLDHDQIAAEVIKSPAESWLPSEYIVYALYTIHHRALLAQDGLKPVQRRILWSMYNRGITPNVKHVKAATIAGDTMGNYHPHGDASIAEALARLAQKFSMRVPLIDSYGSVGYVTGDSAAAPRYWEARLTPAAMELLREIKDGAVEMIKTFDGEHEEPLLLPVRWPNDIINGTSGLAVGFASMMPAHNPDETMNAAIALLKNPDLSLDELMEIMPGPDLPTGGEVMGIDGIREYFETGSGQFTMRARYKVEHLKRGKSRIIFYELPYGVTPESIMTKVKYLQTSHEMKKKGKTVVIPANPKLSKGLTSVKDLTDRKNGLHLIFETTAGFNHLQVLNELFKLTPLQQPFSVNNTVLVNGLPVQTSVPDLLKNFLDFRRICVAQKAQIRLKKIEDRLHQLEALLAALIDIDKAIHIIRTSETVESAQKELMKSFKLDAEQADYILSMQLRRLTRADAVSLENEKTKLIAEDKELHELLSSSTKINEVIAKDLEDTKKIISSPRRTKIIGLTSNELKEKEKERTQAVNNADKDLPCYLQRFSDGKLMKSSEPFAYKSNVRKFAHTPLVEQIKMRTKDDFVIITNDGIGHKVPMSFLVEGKAMKASDIAEIPTGSKVVGISKMESMKSDLGVAIGTEHGLIKLAKTDFGSRETFPVISLEENDSIVDCRWIGKTLTGTYFTFVSYEGNVLIFDAKTIRPTGSKAGGVKGMKLKSDDDKVVSFGWISSIKDPSVTLITYTGVTIKNTSITDIPTKGRGGMGVATQSFKRGETHIESAYIGKNSVACVSSSPYNVVSLPPIVKRVARGVEFNIGVYLGTSDLSENNA